MLALFTSKTGSLGKSIDKLMYSYIQRSMFFIMSLLPTNCN